MPPPSMPPPPEPDSPKDVRTRGFTHRVTVAAALDWLDQQLDRLPPCPVPLAEAADCVLGADMISHVDVPAFDRSMMDGYALRAADSTGATSYQRLCLTVIGQSLPGEPYPEPVSAGQAVRIMTGAPLPAGADAVLPFEQTETEDGGRRVTLLGDVSPSKNVGRVGEDVTAGQVVLQDGRRLRPQDIGLLASIGVSQVPAVRRPSVRIVVTGNELLPAGTRPSGHRIVDSNGPMLEALVARDGGVPLHPGIIPDEPNRILEALRQPADLVIVSGGSSVGQEDHAPVLLAQYGQLAMHGIAMRPSSPTGLGLIDGHVVCLLPGNPVSCLCAYDFFAGRALRTLAGRSREWPYRSVSLALSRKLVSAVGRTDYARVRRTARGVEPLAISGASILSSTSRADGFVLIPSDCEGYAAGTCVDVLLYDA